MAAVKLLYCSAGCSRSRHALSAAPFDLDNENRKNDKDELFVAYASSNFVSIISKSNQEAFSIIATPSLRTPADVSSVFCFSPEILLFGTSDGTLCLYSSSNRSLFTRKMHAEAITSIHACWFQQNKEFFIVSCSADGLVRISVGSSKDNSFTGQQDIKASSRSLPLEVHCTKADFCGGSLFFLFVGYDDGTIRLFTSPVGAVDFQPTLQLTGHVDWVTSLATFSSKQNRLILTSASQDSTVRVWKFYTASENVEKLSSLFFDVPASCLRIYARLETILKGHTDWVYTCDICFDKTTSLMNVLTCSVDRSVIVWQEPGDDSGEAIWTESARFARIGGTGSAAGMSYCGARFAHGGDTVVAHSFTGALHAWKRVASNEWRSIPMPSGHLGQAADVAWEPDGGQYLLSVGGDQTTRLHAPWYISPESPPIWYEFGRPQVHGYGFNSVAMVTSTSFVSAADEKAMRLFGMPRLCKNLLSRLCNFKTDESDKTVDIADGAIVPPLGLTNRPYGDDDDEENKTAAVETEDVDDDGGEGGSGRQKRQAGGEQAGKAVTAVSVASDSQPPTPEVLVQHTLWPELRKLYGHGSEVFTVDVSSCAQLIASACKATSSDIAKIILWAPWVPPPKPNRPKPPANSNDWRPVQYLDGPTLTVTQVRFSHSGKYLLAVCRDRTFHLYQRGDAPSPPSMTRCASLEKSSSPHARIIWSCDWAHDDALFVTGSRDQRILIWQSAKVVANGLATQPAFSAQLSGLPSSVTAVAFASNFVKENCYLLAAGFESGEIILYHIETHGENDSISVKETLRLPISSCPSRSISRLCFQPKKTTQTGWILAASSNDWSIRLYKIPVDNL